jgi:hypothetical protein
MIMKEKMKDEIMIVMGKYLQGAIHESPLQTQTHLHHIMEDRLHIVVFFDFIQ